MRNRCFIQKEIGRAFTAKGIPVFEETVNRLITESGMEIDNNAGESGHETEEDQLLEEVTFDRCFYVYGGPEQLERLSEMCCIAVSHLLILGKSVTHTANKVQYADDEEEDILTIEWPEDSIEKAKTIRTKAQSMAGYLEAVAIGFVTGITDVAEAYAATIKSANLDFPEVLPEKSIQDKVHSFSEALRANRTTTVSKIQDGLHFLAYVILST